VELAREVGSERAANMIMIGAVSARMGILAADDVVYGMKMALKGKDKFFELNQKAIERGAGFATAA
jgi:2-oxoglutarate ferredoxin oxidoreductase subunit gamma